MARRTQLAIGFGAVLVLTLAVTVGFAVWPRAWSDKFADQLTAVTSVFATGTFVLAVVAGVIALAAYIASIQPRDLDVELESSVLEAKRARVLCGSCEQGHRRLRESLG